MAASKLSISSRHGANVVSAGNTVTWCLKTHLGTCTTNRPLRKGDIQKFKVTGTGHLLLGLLPSRPDLDKLVDVEPTSVHRDGHFTLFRLKRETAMASLKRIKSGEIAFTRLSQEQSESESITFGHKDIFVFWEILFGDLIVEIDKELNPKVCFDISTSSCRNVTLENSQTVLKLVDPNYGALCCLDRALETGEVIRLNISQCPDANTTYTRLFLSNKDPNQFDFDGNHVSSNRFLFPTGGKEFKKEGVAQVSISEGTLLCSYQDKHFSVDIRGPDIDGNRPCYLYLELYRVSVQIESVLPETEGKVDFAKLLLNNHTKLMQRMEPDQVADHLFEDRIMSETAYENYMVPTKTRREKCEIVLSLMRRKPESKNTFIRALRGSTDADLLTVMGLDEL